MSLVPSEPPQPPVYLDRPQPLGIWPTLRFWNQPDVWRHVAPFMAVLAPAWALTVGIALSGMLPLWMLAILGGLGTVLILGLIERLIRRRMRQRALGSGRAGLARSRK
jgi:hypothetical protein